MLIGKVNSHSTGADVKKSNINQTFWVSFLRCVRILGKLENIRVVQLSLFQGVAKAMQVAPTVEMKASDNPALENVEPDPTIFCTAFKKNRFYMVRSDDSDPNICRLCLSTS